MQMTTARARFSELEAIMRAESSKLHQAQIQAAVDAAKENKMKVQYTSIDGAKKTRGFKTLAAAQKFAQGYIGATPTLGMTYAVSDDGIGKITALQGVTLAELFPGSVGTDAEAVEQGGHEYRGADAELSSYQEESGAVTQVTSHPVCNVCGKRLYASAKSLATRERGMTCKGCYQS